MREFWWLVPIYLLLINVFTYLAFWMDKERAQLGLYRISEGNLLFLAMLGGSPAALFARHHLRHKTRKQPFGAMLFGIIGIQIGAGVWLGLIP